MYRLTCILLFSVAFVAFAIMPNEDLPLFTYTLQLLATKGISALAFYATFRIIEKYEPKTH